MAFRPVSIPLNKGMNQGTADFGIAEQDLISATNVVFSKQGAIRGRPGTVTMDGQVVAYDKPSSSNGGTLATALTNYQSAGLHVDAQGGTLLQTHGRMFRRAPGSSQWLDVGPSWSMKRLTYAPAGTFSLQDDVGSNALNSDLYISALDMGVNVAGIQIASGVSSTNGTVGFAVYNADGTVLGPRTPTPSASNLQDHRGVSVANSAVFWLDSSTITTLRCQLPGGTPLSGSLFTLAADATANVFTSYNQQRIWAAWDGTNYYVAYIAGTAPNDTIKILKVSTAGAVTGTLTYTTATTVNSLCLAVDSATGKGLLCYTTQAASQVRSQVFTLSTMVDAAIPTTRVPINTTNTVGAVCAIKGTVGYLGWHGHAFTTTYNSLELSIRSMSAGTDTVVAVYGGPASGTIPVYADQSGPTATWLTMFPPTLVAGRMLMGIQNGQRNPNRSLTVAQTISPCTWAVIDITDMDGIGYPALVAAGEVGDCAMVARAASAALVGTGLLFGVPQGVQFTANGMSQAAFTPVLLTPQAAPSTQSGQHTLFGGTVLQSYEGNHVAEVGWVQGQPTILGYTFSSAGGWFAGSYTVSAVWVFVDGLGQRQRSLPAPLATVTAAGANQLTLVVSNPLISNKAQMSPSSTYSNCTLELYATTINPSATSPLYLIASTPIDTRPVSSTNAVTTVVIGASPTTAAPQLYTTGNVLGDERPGGADRGVTVVGNRVWTADERFLYASHVRTPNVAPSFNNEVFAILVPEAYGTVQGICAIDDKVAAVCARGVLIVAGPGLDDGGTGPGWSEPERIASFGGCGPARTVCSHPQGGAFIGTDGLLYGISRSAVVQCMGQPVRDSAETLADLVYVPPGLNIGWDVASNPLLVYGTTTLKVLDLVTGQWCTWTGNVARALVGAPTGLQMLSAGDPFVLQFSASGGQDLGRDFAMSIRLAPKETTQEGLMSGWGRVQSVNPVFKTLAAHTISVQAYADEEQVVILNKSFSVPG